MKLKLILLPYLKTIYLFTNLTVKKCKYLTFMFSLMFSYLSRCLCNYHMRNQSPIFHFEFNGMFGMSVIKLIHAQGKLFGSCFNEFTANKTKRVIVLFTMSWRHFFPGVRQNMLYQCKVRAFTYYKNHSTWMANYFPYPHHFVHTCCYLLLIYKVSHD